MSKSIGVRLGRKSLGELRFGQVRAKFEKVDWDEDQDIIYREKYKRYIDIDDDSDGLVLSKSDGTFMNIIRVRRNANSIEQEPLFRILLKLLVPYKTVFGNIKEDLKYGRIWPIAKKEVVLKIIELYYEGSNNSIWNIYESFLQSYRDTLPERGFLDAEPNYDIYIQSTPINKELEQSIL